MKFSPLVLFFAGFCVPLQAQEKAPTKPTSEPSGKWHVEISHEISDGKPAAPAPPAVAPEFQVKESRTIRKDVVESPPMPGLPPVQGRISMTVRKVVDPKLPPLPVALPSVFQDDPEMKARLEEFKEKYHRTELVFVSATVYDHSRTFLRILPNGQVEGEVTAWSNIDFNHFAGVGSYRATSPEGETMEFGLLMGLGNVDTANMEKLAAKGGSAYEKTQIPRLPDIASGPAFVIVSGEDSKSEALDILSQIHELYTTEGSRMETAYLRRVAEEKKLRQFYEAHPPKPKDLVLNYWRGKSPAGAASNRTERP